MKFNATIQQTGRIFIIIILFTLLNNIHSQDNFVLKNENLFHTTQFDTAKLLSDTPLKSPWGAVLRSAIIPGWGQIYTEHYIKAAIGFSVNAFFLAQIYRYEMKWRDVKDENYRTKRNQNTWYFALSYLLTMVDAYVDAYLYKFDEAMEISQHFQVMEGICYAEFKFSVHF